LIDPKLVGFILSSVKIATGQAMTEDQEYCVIILFGNITDRPVVVLKGFMVEG
jgi:hypothetical protein